MVSLKAAKNWEKNVDYKLEICNIRYAKVRKIKCIVCSKCESQISAMKGFSKGWIEGTESIKEYGFTYIKKTVIPIT